jgi:hypothetical protein
MANRYLVLLEFSECSNSHLNFKFEGKIKFIAVTYTRPLSLLTFVLTFVRLTFNKTENYEKYNNYAIKCHNIFLFSRHTLNMSASITTLSITINIS